MNPYDPLEDQLRALRPRLVSADFKDRVVDRLRGSTSPERPLPWAVPMAAMLAAACLAAIALWQGNSHSERPGTVQPPALQSIADDSAPTVLAYRRALVRSAERLDALLDQHAVEILRPDPKPVPIRAFSRLTFEISAITGEL